MYIIPKGLSRELSLKINRRLCDGSTEYFSVESKVSRKKNWRVVHPRVSPVPRVIDNVAHAVEASVAIALS